MGSIGLPELLVIMAILALIFGASRLPELGRGLGRGIRSFKDATRDGMKDDAEAQKSPRGVEMKS
jgi:sec-independent protein translocase protein TatA